MWRATRADAPREVEAVRLAAVLVLAIAGACLAGPAPERAPEALVIEGMEPITAADLTRFSGLAVRLAATAGTNPTVRPILLETLGQEDRGIVKRAIAHMALCAMGDEPAARALLRDNFRDRAVMKIVRASLAEAEGLARLPR